MTYQPWISVYFPPELDNKIHDMMDWCDRNLGTRRVAWDYVWYMHAFEFPSSNNAAWFTLTFF